MPSSTQTEAAPAARQDVGGQLEKNSDSKDYDLAVVDWDGGQDPADPRNWAQTTKMIHVGLVSIFTLYA